MDIGPLDESSYTQWITIWPDGTSEYPSNNPDYPIIPIGWTREHDRYFLDWLREKDITAKCFHQEISYHGKLKLLWEFEDIEDIQFGIRPGNGRFSGVKNVPKPDPYITPQTMKGNYPREPSNTPFLTGDYSLDFGLSRLLWNKLLCFIDWLNRLVGAEKPKNKTSDEQMKTLAELFDGYEEDDLIRFEGTPYWDSPEIILERREGKHDE